MTSPPGHSLSAERWLIAAVLFAAFSELGLRELHHQFASESSRLRNLCLLTGLLAVLSWMTGRIGEESYRRWVSRGLAAVACLAAAGAILAPTLSASAERAGTAPWAAAAVGFSLLAVLSPAWLWNRCRPMLAAAAIMFVWSQPALVALFAPTIAWPPSQASLEAQPGDRSATLVLLLDELNANEAPKLEAALRGLGLDTASRRINSVEHNTIQVIPNLFARAPFGDAKACSTTAVCSEGKMLDFARVVATRPDIDIVGFFHPYCAIQGLRWCRRVGLGWNVWNKARWRCALWRRTGWPSTLNLRTCARIESQPWEELRAHTLDEVQRAPVMQVGGVLYAHLPLPHPPGSSPDGTLAADYQHDVGRLARWLEQTVRRLHQNGLSPRIVLFSDHPLRWASWCSAYQNVRGAACGDSVGLRDDAVPLIVAAERGVSLPSLDGITRNDEVFPLIRYWPWTRLPVQ